MYSNAYSTPCRMNGHGVRDPSSNGQGAREFKRIAMRSDKTDESFEAMIYACAAIINSR